MLEEAITMTNDKGIFLNLETLTKVIRTALHLPKRTKEELNKPLQPFEYSDYKSFKLINMLK